MLLREMMSDPFLEHYGVIIIDHAHERTVSTDILLGLLKDILLQRPDLRVVVLAIPPMTAKLLSHYGHIPLISLEPSSPARVVHSNSGNKDYFYSALRLVLEIHRTKEDGDVVVFFASAQVRDLFECFHWPKAKTGFTLLVISSEGGSLCPEHPTERRNQAWSRAWPDGASGSVPRPWRATACPNCATRFQEVQEGFPLYPKG